MRIRGRTALAALLAIAFGGSVQPAAAEPSAPVCEPEPSQAIDPAIHGQLPIYRGESDARLARFALPYAFMAASSEDEDYLDDVTPYGFVPGPNSTEIFTELADGTLAQTFITGFHGDTFFHCREKSIIVVIRAMTTWDVRDWLSGLVRHTGTGEAPMALKFFDAVHALYPDYDIAVVGHSAAGGITSFLAGARGVPSVVFNPSRTDAAFINDGTKQLIVYVNGDVLSDPAAPRPDGVMAIAQAVVEREDELSGTVLRVDPPSDFKYIFRLHQMDILISGLEALIN